MSSPRRRSAGWPNAVFTLPLRPWEQHFTVVQWDHRGAGKTLRLAESMGTLTGLPPAKRRPDLVHALVATDLYVNIAANEATKYQLTLEGCARPATPRASPAPPPRRSPLPLARRPAETGPPGPISRA